MKYNSFETFMNSIREGKLCIGCCITFSDPVVTEMAAEAGFDFCWIDGEHGELDRITALMHIMALKGTNCAPFFRVPACSHTEIKKIIDFAPAGVIIPMIMNAEDAEYAVKACRYPLVGNRGCGMRRGNAYGMIPNDEYFQQAQKEPLVILQIEHIDAYRDLDRILAVPGVDSILIGPYDLSCSMGKTAQWDDPEVRFVLDDLCARTRNAGKILGTYCEYDFESWKKRGVQYISCINDTGALLNGFNNIITNVKSGFQVK